MEDPQKTIDRFPPLKDKKGEKLFKVAKDHYAQGDYVMALEVIEDLSFVKGTDKGFVAYLQGSILNNLAKKTENTDLKFTYWMGSVEIFSAFKNFTALAAMSLFQIAQLRESVLYYKKSLEMAKQSEDALQNKKFLKDIIETSMSKIAESKNGTVLVKESKHYEQEVKESEENEENTKIESDFVKGLKSYWLGLNVEERRNFMKVSIADFTSFVQRLYGKEGRNALEKVLSSVRKGKKWRLWICRSCSEEFSSAKECKNHVEQEHEAGFQPHAKVDKVQRISKAWCSKILVRGWEPVDAVAAVAMIKNSLDYVKAFAYENGWSKDWPLAADEERSKSLQEIRFLLVTFCDCNILPSSVIDWVMDLMVSHLEKHEVSKLSLTECGLVETPQSICFLESHALNQILDLLKRIKCERDDGTDLVCRAVDSFYNGTRVKEKIDFDTKFSSLLLDKRLLQCKITQFDDEGTVNFLNGSAHYAKAHAHGDDILSWLREKSSGDEEFRFPRPIRAHNLDVWVAVLGAVQFTFRTLGTKYYAKKYRIGQMMEVLIDAKNLCIREDEMRKNIPEDQWNTYASLIYDTCETMRLVTSTSNSLMTRTFFTAVGDVLKGVSHPTFDLPVLEDCLNVIRDHKHVGDDWVLKSIDNLKSVMTKKVTLIDSKILLVEHSRTNLLNYLARLSVFDYRSYILRPLKEFLLEGILDMKLKAKVAAAQADLLLEEEMKSQSKKKKNKSNKDELAAAQALKVLSENKQDKGKSTVSKKKKRKNKKKTAKGDQEEAAKGDQEEGAKGDQEEAAKGDREEAAKGDREEAAKGAREEAAKGDREEAAKGDRVEAAKGDREEAAKGDRDEAAKGDREKAAKGDREEAAKGYREEAAKGDREEAAKDMQNMPVEDSLSEHAEGPSRYNSALDMTLKALGNIKVLKEYLVQNRNQSYDNLEERVPFSLGNFFTAFVSKQMKEKGVYNCLLSDLLASLEEVCSMSSYAGELLVAILEFWPCWKSPEIVSVVTHLFTLEEHERMSCSNCRKKPNYPEQSSYGIVMAADLIRDLKCTFGNMKFEDILKLIRMEDAMLCDIKTGGCGKANFGHHIISRCLPIFTIVLEWEKDETEKEICETRKALNWEIDMSRLYEGLEPNTKYRLVSMIGCGEEHICLAYRKNRWVSFRHEASAKEVVGNWNSMVRFCEERNIRPEILFYEAFQWPNK